MKIPDIFQQHGARNDLIVVSHHELKQTVFPWLQHNGPVAACDCLPEAINLQIRDLQHQIRGGVYVLLPAYQCIESGLQFSECIGA